MAKFPALKCKHCGDIVVSTQRYDMKHCWCKAIAIDWDPNYSRYIGNPEDYERLEVEVEINSDKNTESRNSVSTSKKKNSRGPRGVR